MLLLANPARACAPMGLKYTREWWLTTLDPLIHIIPYVVMALDYAVHDETGHSDRCPALASSCADNVIVPFSVQNVSSNDHGVRPHESRPRGI